MFFFFTLKCLPFLSWRLFVSKDHKIFNVFPNLKREWDDAVFQWPGQRWLSSQEDKMLGEQHAETV